MVVSPSQDLSSTPVAAASGDNPVALRPVLSAAVIWHDLECGSYRADLPLWRELAEREGDPILDVGAGSGRVALELAGDGHHVTALDFDPDLLSALRDRSGGLPLQTVRADARSFDLASRDFALCLVPMQTIQLLGVASERAAFLRCARAHLRSGGLLACAIATELESFDVADGSPAPTPETTRVGEALYISQAESVRVLPRRIVIGRLRRIVSPAASGSSDASSNPEPHDRNAADEPVERPADERNVVELARVRAAELECEGAEVGFRPEPALVIEPTEEHVGSVVVMLRA
jgi:SAM-dependent methyltransferase